MRSVVVQAANPIHLAEIDIGQASLSSTGIYGCRIRILTNSIHSVDCTNLTSGAVGNVAWIGTHTRTILASVAYGCTIPIVTYSTIGYISVDT